VLFTAIRIALVRRGALYWVQRIEVVGTKELATKPMLNYLESRPGR